MERIQNVERVHASQTNALRIALDDLHSTSAVIPDLRQHFHPSHVPRLASRRSH